MAAIAQNTIPTTIKVLSQYYPSFFNLAVGRRFYLLDGSGNQVNAYLPAPVAGVELWLVAKNVANAVYVKGSSAVKINGQVSVTIQLPTVGSVLVVTAQSSITWLTHNMTVRVF